MVAAVVRHTHGDMKGGASAGRGMAHTDSETDVLVATDEDVPPVDFAMYVHLGVTARGIGTSSSDSDTGATTTSPPASPSDGKKKKLRRRKNCRYTATRRRLAFSTKPPRLSHIEAAAALLQLGATP